MLKIIFILSVTVLLSGCFGSPSSIPEDKFYTLKIGNANVVTTKYKRISIARVKAYGLYNERAMLYTNSDLPLVIKRYHYHHWVMPPAQLIQHGLKNYLKTSKISNEVVSKSFDSDSLKIQAELLAFERVIYSDSQEVNVEVSFELKWPDGKYKNLKYKRNVKSKDNTLHSSANAYSIALSQIFRSLLLDL